MDYRLNIIEKFVLSVYYPERSSFKSIDHKRMDAFTASLNSNLQSVPFSRKGLKEHTKRACFQSGWFCKEGEKITRPIRVGIENEKR